MSVGKLVGHEWSRIQYPIDFVYVYFPSSNWAQEFAGKLNTPLRNVFAINTFSLKYCI